MVNLIDMIIQGLCDSILKKNIQVYMSLIPLELTKPADGVDGVYDWTKALVVFQDGLQMTEKWISTGSDCDYHCSPTGEGAFILT